MEDDKKTALFNKAREHMRRVRFLIAGVPMKDKGRKPENDGEAES